MVRDIFSLFRNYDYAESGHGVCCGLQAYHWIAGTGCFHKRKNTCCIGMYVPH